MPQQTERLLLPTPNIAAPIRLFVDTIHAYIVASFINIFASVVATKYIKATSHLEHAHSTNLSLYEFTLIMYIMIDYTIIDIIHTNNGFIHTNNQ